MALQAEQTVSHGVITLALQQADGEELALGLTHLAGIGVQMVDMEPVIAPLVTHIALRLGNLIGVVREGIVDAAGVDIQILAQVLHGNAGTLNMPAGITNAPRRIPLQRLILKLGLGEPQNEVVLILLVGVLFHALTDAHCQIFFIVVAEDIVLIQRGGVKVDIAAGKIGLAIVQQLLHHLDVGINAVGSRLHHIGALNVQLLAIGKEGVGVELCNIHNSLVLTLCALEHLILAGVGIAGQVTHVGDVHNTLNRIANIAQSLFQHILHNVGAEVTDMGIVIDRGAAGIHLDQFGIIRNKQFLLMRKRVIQIHRNSSNVLFKIHLRWNRQLQGCS